MARPRPTINAGDVFGLLTVLGGAGQDKYGHYLLACRCACGNEKITTNSKLHTGHTKSCGCFRPDCSGRQVYKRVVAVCQYCAGFFATSENRIRDGRGRYCSKDCKHRAALLTRQQLLDNIMRSYEPIPMCGCWVWMGDMFPNGYGSVGIGSWTGKPRDGLAHKVAYEMLVGPVPPGLELDHLCRVRCCINPAHLEPVTKSVNALRGIAARRMGL